MTIFKNITKIFSGHRGNPDLHLSVFGKHPAWNDHIDDLGLDTEQLAGAKQLLYAHGINKNIDNAAWDNLAPDHRLDHFGHHFLWYMPPALIAGQLHASTDGKGRDKYPLVLALQFENLPDNFAVDPVLPFLTQFHRQLTTAADIPAFTQFFESAGQSLQTLAQNPPAASALTAASLAALARHPDLRPAEMGLHRILYQLAHSIPAYSLYAKASASKTLSPRPHQLRVPIAGMSPPQALLFYLRLSLTLLDPAASILLLAPQHSPWLDILVGEPAAANFFCLKANTRSIPLTSDIPYTLPAHFTSTVNHFLADCAAAPPNTPLPPWPEL